MRRAMLTVLIETQDDAEALARTLVSLVGGAVEGVVREVLVHGPADAGVETVSEHAGCRFVSSGELLAALAGAKGEWLLILQAGARPAEGWTEAVLDYAAANDMPARFTLSRASRPPLLLRLFRRRVPLEAGLLIPKRKALPLMKGKGGTPEKLARGLATKRLAAEFLPAKRR